MKVACLIFGLLRTFPNHIEHMKNKFQKYDIDYFIHITNNYNDEYNTKKCNYEEMINILKPVQTIIEYDMNYKNSIYINAKKQWYKFSVLNNVKNYYEEINNIKYDIVLRIRPDLLILDNTFEFDNLIEDGVIYGNDEFFYSNKYTADILAKLIYKFDELNNESITKKTDFFYNYLKLRNIIQKNIDIEYKLVLTLCNIIAIAGDSGTGKTTLVKKINKLFKDYTLKLEGDRYHRWERGDKNWEHYTHLNPEANYICKFKEDVFKLKVGSNIYQVDYDHSNGKFTEIQEVKSSKNILICGLHTLFDNNTNKLYNLKIFLDTDDKLKYYWKISRDTNERGYKIKDVLEKILRRKKDNKRFIEPQKYNSNLVIRFFTDNEFDYTNLINKPNIYLSLTYDKDVKDFSRKLDRYNIDYSYTQTDDITKLTFYEVQNFSYIFFEYFKKDSIDIESYDYYTLILAFIMHIR